MNSDSYRFVHWLMSLCVIASAIALPASQGLQAAPQHDLAEINDDPIPVVTDDDFNTWTIANGLVYWASACPGGEFVGPGYLKRKPLNGGYQSTLATTTAINCVNFHNMVADETGLYYYSTDGLGDAPRGIHYYPAGNASEPQLVLAISDFNTPPLQGTRVGVDDTYVYWLTRAFDSTPQLLRHAKDGSGSTELVANVAEGGRDLLVVGSTIYWFDSSGLWSTNITSCSALPCTKTNLAPGVNGDHLVYHFQSFFAGSHLYWVENGNQIRRRTCSRIITPSPTLIAPFPMQANAAPDQSDGAAADDAVNAAAVNEVNAPEAADGSCNINTVYTAPTDNPWQIGRPAVNDDHIFWNESYFTFDEGSDSRLRRKASAETNAEDIAVNLGIGPSATDFYNGYVYFPFEGLKKLPWDAPPIVRDLTANSMEVTQAIQSLDNDVPLVANKETYVRAYGRQNSGPHASAVKAQLVGSRSGNPLPGSPLNSINGSLGFAVGAIPNRAIRNDGWLFQLPNSWTNDGNVTLELVVDPLGTYSDPNPANNRLSRTVNFQDKAPICMVSVPVRTHAPAASSDLASFWPMVDMAERMLPTADIKTYKQNNDIAELQVCWWGPFPHPCHGPYELPDDDWKIMASLWTRDLFSDDPDACDDANAVTHYVGIIHPSTFTDGLNGMGNRPGSNLMIHLPPLNEVPLNWRNWSPSEQRSPRAASFPHELGHNYNRKHIACGDPDDPDNNYPYTNPDRCRLDDGALDAPSTHFVWDIERLQPVAPDQATDLMSYGRPRFPSDYTWKAIFNRIDNAVTAAGISAASVNETIDIRSTQTASAASAFNLAENIVLVTGAYTPTNIVENGGLIDYAFVFPKNEASPGQLRKWFSSALSVFGASSHDGHNHASAAADDTVNFRLLDPSGAVLADQPAIILELEDNENDQLAVAATIPEPTGDVATVQLIVNGTVVASRTPGPAIPALNLSAPTAGETVDQELTVTWSASDADSSDRLIYVVQYSHDNGEHWRTVSNGIAGSGNEDGDNVLPVSITFNASDLPGSNGQTALVRVFASDGYHTDSATSEPFSVTTRKPEPYILNPVPNASLPADQPILLRGSASDAEDGSISADNLTWSVNGTEIGTGESQIVVGLGPGSHTIVLEATDSDGGTASVERIVTVRPLEISTASAPTIDGFCDDESYVDGTELNLKPYGDGNQATVQMLRSGNTLYACFHNMKRGAAETGAAAAILIDKNNSRDDVAQTDDYGFFIGEDGGQFTTSGDGSGAIESAGPDGLQAQISANENAWAAEMRIDASVLDNWEHPISLSVGHIQVEAADDNYMWPYASTVPNPNTWAETAFGTTPQITDFSPNSAMAGSDPVTVVISGTGFMDGAIVAWNDVDLTAEVGSSTVLSVTLPAQQLAEAGTNVMVVRNPSTLASAPVRFQVADPAPALDSVTPNVIDAESNAPLLIVSGSGFMEGATILWDGMPLQTTYGNGGQLTAQLEASSIAVGGRVNVAVNNPGIGGHSSNSLPIEITPAVDEPESGSSIFLPFVPVE